MYIVKQTAQCYSPYVSKVLVTRLPALRGRNGLHWYIVARQRSIRTFWNRRRGAVCRVFQNSSWRSSRRFVEKWVVWCILVTQPSRCTFWNRRRGAVCRVFQKSSWRSSRRFVEKWNAWMYFKDAALKKHNLKQTARRFVLCVSKVFVTKFPSLRGEMIYMGVYWRRSAEMRILKQTAWHCVPYIGDAALRCAFWNRRRDTACRMFQNSSWRRSRRFVEKWSIWVYIGEAALRCTFLNRRRETACCMFQNSSWRSCQRFVDEVPRIWRCDGITKVLKRLAIWWVLGVAVCFKTAST